MAKSMSAHAAKADIHPTTPKRQLSTRSGLRARPARLLLSPVAVTLPMPEFAPVPMATDLSNLSLRSWQRSSCLFSAVAPRVINFRGGRSVRPRCLLLAQRRRQPSFFRHVPHGSVAGLDVPLSRPLVTQTQTQIATSTTWDFCKRLPVGESWDWECAEWRASRKVDPRPSIERLTKRTSDLHQHRRRNTTDNIDTAGRLIPDLIHGNCL